MKDKLLTILYIVLIIIVTAIIAKLCGKEPEEEQEVYQERIEQSQNDLQIIDSLLRAEIISFYPDVQLIYYDEDRWFEMSRRERKKITIILGAYTTNKLDKGAYWISICGMYTKKSLARWSGRIGYKEYIFYELSDKSENY